MVSTTNRMGGGAGPDHNFWSKTFSFCFFCVLPESRSCQTWAVKLTFCTNNQKIRRDNLTNFHIWNWSIIFPYKGILKKTACVFHSFHRFIEIIYITVRQYSQFTVRRLPPRVKQEGEECQTCAPRLPYSQRTNIRYRHGVELKGPASQ